MIGSLGSAYRRRRHARSRQQHPDSL